MAGIRQLTLRLMITELWSNISHKSMIISAGSVLVLFFELVADLVRDSLLVFAFFGQLFIAYGVPENFLGLADDDVLPGCRRFGRLVIMISHDVRLARVGSGHSRQRLFDRCHCRAESGSSPVWTTSDAMSRSFRCSV